MSSRRGDSPPVGSAGPDSDARASLFEVVCEELRKLSGGELRSGEQVREHLDKGVGVGRLDEMHCTSLLQTIAEVFAVDVHVWRPASPSGFHHCFAMRCKHARETRVKRVEQINLVQHGVPASHWSPRRARGGETAGQ